jgi:hypothetical protein
MADATGAYLYQPGEGELRWLGGMSAYFLAGGGETGGAFCLVDEQASRVDSVPLYRQFAAARLGPRVGDPAGEHGLGVEFVGPLPDRIE